MAPDDRAFEYATGLFAVLIGLAVVDIATSFHRLLNSEKRIVWDPLTLLAALYALCLVVAMWFDLWGVRHFQATRNFLFYLSLIAQFFLLFLTAAASLPDEPDSFEGDLRKFFAKKQRKFWTLVVLFHTEYALAGLYFAGGESPDLPRAVLVLTYLLMFAPILISFTLVFVRTRVAQYTGLLMLLGLLLLHYGRASIR